MNIQELRAVLNQIEKKCDLETLTLKEKSTFVADLLQNIAVQKNIDLKLRKQKQ